MRVLQSGSTGGFLGLENRLSLRRNDASSARDHLGPTQTREVTMSRLRMESCLLLAASLAACGEGNTPTAPMAGPWAAKSAGDHTSYTWQLSCTGDGGSYAKWSWTTAGATTGTGSATCYPGSGGGSTGGPDPRPADADGFTASVNGHPQTWTVVPGSAF